MSVLHEVSGRGGRGPESEGGDIFRETDPIVDTSVTPVRTGGSEGYWSNSFTLNRSAPGKLID